MSTFCINVKYIKIIQGDIFLKISDISNLTNFSNLTNLLNLMNI